MGTFLTVLKDIFNNLLILGGGAGLVASAGWTSWVSAGITVIGFILSALHVAETSTVGKVFADVKMLVSSVVSQFGSPSAPSQQATSSVVSQAAPVSAG